MEYMGTTHDHVSANWTFAWLQTTGPPISLCKVIKQQSNILNSLQEVEKSDYRGPPWFHHTGVILFWYRRWSPDGWLPCHPWTYCATPCEVKGKHYSQPQSVCLGSLIQTESITVNDFSPERAQYVLRRKYFHRGGAHRSSLPTFTSQVESNTTLTCHMCSTSRVHLVTLNIPLFLFPLYLLYKGISSRTAWRGGMLTVTQRAQTSLQFK